MVFINPKIINQSKKKQLVEEGCLSVRYIYGEVSRAEKTTIEAYDENGNKFSRGFSGFLSQIVQHETDHLNGGLFIDRAKHTVELTKEEHEKSIEDMK
jgi:peptide deformylase